ncbi:lipase maturation factor 2-like [Phymastichus coffea]|uniref:lipase maturation factor 2-like n=1 Tax=Phymastichus coffea TaxID=108790 RepID=UPI00273C7529|nr:lipase maturation factor 2-like [Phymastichus coffea]
MSSVRYTRNLFLRGICVIYLFAFLSFYYQIPGLYGDNGVLPAKTQLDLNSRTPLLQKMRQKPTLLWLAPYIGLNVEYMLDVLSLFGIIFSFFGFVSQKFCSAPVFAGLWSFYYSIYQVGQTFMWFQWDLLLLEAGFLCIIVAPFQYSNQSRKSTPSDTVTFWAVRWLLFRLMYSSGVLKFTSGCPLWWNLNALSVHFESQCIPTPLAWYAHHLPKWFLRFTTVGALVIEIVVPFLFFFPIRKVRIVSFYLQLLIQLNIIATGNYNFFNLLTIILCISLLDDQFFHKKRPKNDGSKVLDYLKTLICILVYGGMIYGTHIYFNVKLTNDWTISSKIGFTKEQFEYVLSRSVTYSIWIGAASISFISVNALTNSAMNSKGAQKKFVTTLVTLIYTVIVVFIFTLSVVPYSTSVYPKINSTLPKQLKKIHANLDHFHLVNSYGLFRKMTGISGRPEVVIEGSNDIEGPWKEYHFLYKPGDVNATLPFVAPHQPRLDWQMWFAALGTYHQNPWLMSLTYRLLHGQPEVLALLNNAKNPFQARPPKFIRASLYTYHYTPSDQSSSQSWWKREVMSEYLPIYSRDHPPLIEYISKMKILQDKPNPKVTNTTFKALLDFLRSLVAKVDATLVLWSVFTAGLAVIMTG